MAFPRLAVIMAAVLLLWSTIANAAGPVRPFKHGFWTGGAYTDDRTGAFTHCSAGVAYDSGINLFVLVTGEYRWWLGFINPKWSFTPNAKEPIRLLLDNGASFNRLATIPSGQLLLVPLPDSSRLIDAFRRGSELALEAEGKSFVFKLNDTPAVMDRLTSCVQTSLALKEKTSPLASASSPASRSTAASSSTSATAPASESKGGPAEAGWSAAPALSGPVSTPLGPATANASEPPAASKTASSVTEPQAAGSPNHSPDSVAAAPRSTSGEKTTAAPSSPEKSFAAAESPSNLSPEDPFSSFGKGGASQSLTPQASGATEISPAASQAMPASQTMQKELAISPADATPSRSGPSSPASSETSTPAAAVTKEADGTAHTGQGPSAPPPLAFTALSPVAPARMASPPRLGAQSEGTNSIEEVRLATDFLNRARLADARLVDADKPPALADFAAVWRSEDAAGAVKIIPPGPDVSAIGIASNLIAVDPKVCKGDFTAARFRNNIGKTLAFTAVLSCSDANQQRVTEYFITPRHQGGFAVFAVIHSKSIGEAPDFDRETIDILSRAAIEAVAHEG